MASRILTRRELRGSNNSDNSSETSETSSQRSNSKFNDSTTSPKNPKETLQFRIIPSAQQTQCLIKNIDNTYNSKSLINDVNFFASIIQTLIAIIVLATLVLDILVLNFYQTRTSALPKQQSWFASKPIEPTREPLYFWRWVFVAASIFGINIITLLLFLFDMKQILNSGYRVSKNLIMVTLICGGWLIGPCLFYTEYLRLNDIDIKKFSIFLAKISAFSIGSIGLVFILCNLIN